MGFIIWHYTEGLQLYINRWLSYFDWINHYFSLHVLIRSLFSPWKRLIIIDTKPGFDFRRFFEVITFNLISRGIGVIVRFTLFWVGLFLIIATFVGGIAGLIFWITLPFLGLADYKRYNNRLERYILRLITKINSSKNPIEGMFESIAGKFFLEHLGVKSSDLLKEARLDKVKPKDITASSFKEIIEKFVGDGVWSKEYLRKKKLVPDDLVLAATWFDEKRLAESGSTSLGFGRPGLGLELLFGYTPNLNQYSIDLSTPQSYSHRLIGREQVVSRMERVLTGGASIVLVGAPGVGKKTVVLEFAHRAASGKLGAEMAYRRVLEFDHNFLLAEASDLNLKKKKLAQILDEAAQAGNIIIMIRDIQRLTHPDIEGYDFTDIFEEYMEKKNLKIIAVATDSDYERFIAPNMRLRKFLEKVEVNPPSKEEAMEILVEAAQRWEKLKDLTIQVPTLRKILDESDRYITEVPFPEKALELLDAVVMFREQKGGKTVGLSDAKKILAEKTGVSFAKLTSKEKKRLGNLEEIIHKRLIDQDSAVNLIAKSLRAKTVGVTKEERPLGTFLFLGPTGVGKTETAKVLARVYYGSVDKLIRFDMAEFSGKEGLERLIGSVSENRPGVLTSAIKNKPASLLLLDEIEKAKKDIYNLFLTLLDEGNMRDAFGKKIIGRHLFVIGTSNAGAEYIRQLVSKGVRGEDLQKKVLDHVLEKGIFSPEFINRFDGVVVYEPLRKEDLVKIARILLNELAENLKQKNIYLEVTTEAAKKLAIDGYQPEFGARPMKRIINLILGDLLGKAILKGEIKEGSRIKIVPGEGKEEYSWEKV